MNDVDAKNLNISSRERTQCFIIDPSLVDDAGHHLRASFTLRQCAEKLGFTCQNYVSKNATDAIDLFDYHPHFTGRMYEQLMEILASFPLDSSPTSKIIESELAKIEIDWTGSKILLLFPGVMFFHLTAISAWLKSISEIGNVSAAVWLLFDNEYSVETDDQKKFVHQQYAQSLRALENIPHSGVDFLLLCETEYHRRYFGQHTNIPIEVRAPTCSQRDRCLDPLPYVQGNQAGHIVFAGHINRYKGFTLLPGIIRTVWKRHPSMEFTIQANYSGTNRVLAATTRELESFGPQVKVIARTLDDEEYCELLRSADIILMPYDPINYRTNGSGIYQEGTFLGIPRVVPEIAEFASEGLEQGYCLGFNDWSDVGIGEVLIQAISRWPELKQNALKKAKQTAPGSEHITELLKGLERGYFC